MEEVVKLLDECIGRIDELQRRIDLAPPRARAKLSWVHRELEGVRALVVEARIRARAATRVKEH